MRHLPHVEVELFGEDAASVPVWYEDGVLIADYDGRHRQVTEFGLSAADPLAARPVEAG